MLTLEVKFEKIGNKIKYTLPVDMWCTRMKTYLPKSCTLDKKDGVIIVWLGKNVDKLFKTTNTIYRKVNLSQIYDPCDIPK